MVHCLPKPTCNDSDDGKNYGTYGVCREGGVTKGRDECLDSITLKF